MGLKETTLRAVSCQSALFPHEYFLAGRFCLGAGAVRGLNVRVPLHLSPALSWRQTPCSSVQGSFRKCQSYGGEVGIEQGHGVIDKLVKQNSKRIPLGNQVAESMQAEAPEVSTTMWMLAHILLNEQSQPHSELQGCNSTLRI